MLIANQTMNENKKLKDLRCEDIFFAIGITAYGKTFLNENGHMWRVKRIKIYEKIVFAIPLFNKDHCLIPFYCDSRNFLYLA